MPIIADIAGTKLLLLTLLLLHGLCHNVQSYLNLGTKKGDIWIARNRVQVKPLLTPWNRPLAGQGIILLQQLTSPLCGNIDLRSLPNFTPPLQQTRTVGSALQRLPWVHVEINNFITISGLNAMTHYRQNSQGIIAILVMLLGAQCNTNNIARIHTRNWIICDAAVIIAGVRVDYILDELVLYP